MDRTPIQRPPRSAWASLLGVALLACQPPAPPSPETRRWAAEATDYARGDASQVWRSRAGCEAVVTRGGRAPHDEKTLRIVSWNVRWFPDGAPEAPRTPTDVAWLACALAWLDADAVALQEVLTRPGQPRHPHETARAELLERLGDLTGAPWRASADDCPPQRPDWLPADRTWVRLHDAVLWRTDRLRGGAPTSLAGLNATGHHCAGHLRPGHGTHFEADGLDFHLFSVHAKSGVDPRDWFRRRNALEGASRAFAEAQDLHPDDDVIFAGDWNTMGCPACQPPLDAAAELADMDRRLTAQQPPFRRIPTEPGCSEYYRGRGVLLDHFVVTSLPQVAGSARAHGLCALTGCAPHDALAEPAYQSLSDHCPIALDLPAPGGSP